MNEMNGFLELNEQINALLKTYLSKPKTKGIGDYVISPSGKYDFEPEDWINKNLVDLIKGNPFSWDLSKDKELLAFDIIEIRDIDEYENAIIYKRGSRKYHNQYKLAAKYDIRIQDLETKTYYLVKYDGYSHHKFRGISHIIKLPFQDDFTAAERSGKIAAIHGLIRSR